MCAFTLEIPIDTADIVRYFVKVATFTFVEGIS